jgi:hypothetical protein
MRRSHFIILLLTATPVVVAAQSVKPGDRVQVTAPDLTRYDGTLQALTRDTLTVDTLRIAVASVTRLDVHRGTRSNRGIAVGIGVPLGALAGGIMGNAYGATNDPQFQGLHAAAGMMVGMVGGLVTGLVVGSLIKSDRWEEVPLDQFRVSFVPQRDGRFAFGLSVRF